MHAAIELLRVVYSPKITFFSLKMLKIPTKVLFFYENICSFNKFALYLQNQNLIKTKTDEEIPPPAQRCDHQTNKN